MLKSALTQFCETAIRALVKPMLFLAAALVGRVSRAMQSLVLLATTATFLTTARAADVLSQGKYYRDVKLVGVAPGNKVVVQSEKDGRATVSWTALSIDFRKYHQGELDNLLKIETEKAEGIRAATDPQLKAKIKAKVKSMKEVETDLTSFRGKAFWLTGTLEVSTVYTSGYENAQKTHYAFKLTGDDTYGYVYMERESGAEMRKRLLSGGKAQAICLVEIRIPRSYVNDSMICAELLDARPALD